MTAFDEPHPNLGSRRRALLEEERYIRGDALVSLRSGDTSDKSLFRHLSRKGRSWRLCPQRLYDELERRLGDRPFFCGAFSLADIAVGLIFSSCDLTGI